MCKISVPGYFRSRFLTPFFFHSDADAADGDYVAHFGFVALSTPGNIDFAEKEASSEGNVHSGS